MSKLLKFLKPYAGAVLAILCVLIVQAYCDLSLPTYTSEIVNVGIQQGGIDETVPDTISEEDLDHLLLFVPSDKREAVESAYKEDAGDYDYDGKVMKLKSSVKKDEDKMDELSSLLGKPMLLASGFDSDSDMTKKMDLLDIVGAPCDQRGCGKLIELPVGESDYLAEYIPSQAFSYAGAHP